MGDSLSKNFHLDSKLDLIQKFYFEPAGSIWIDHFLNSLSKEQNHITSVTNLSRPSAYIENCTITPSSARDALLGVSSFQDQIERFEAFAMDDTLLMLFVGNNNLDWTDSGKNLSLSEDDVVKLAIRCAKSYASKLTKLANAYNDQGFYLSIVSLGIINFEDFAKVRRNIESTGRIEAYPYFEFCYELCPIMLPEHEQKTIMFQKVFNSQLKVELNLLQNSLKRHKFKPSVKVLFSPYAANYPVFEEELHASDAWHMSEIGHKRFGSKMSLDPVIQEALNHLSER